MFEAISAFLVSIGISPSHVFAGLHEQHSRMQVFLEEQHWREWLAEICCKHGTVTERQQCTLSR
ncbi:hypothetical protein [Brucella intermedia]|uniref:hypothetical protein n=1 Tax=Brucella intermedia TaxID=94625 RepID=UPI00244D53E6|nr:hypothetical protein [Brucella intermedia]WGG60288.1 hypothetical protein QA414_05045 [Brucella intermedia]